MRFEPSFLDEIRTRLPVSQVVAKRVKLKKAGREWKGLSPFKQEKTPSFTVNDAKGFYHCFASGEHGDIFKFLQVTEGLSFPEAVERLAQEAGLEMPRSSPDAERREKGRDRLRAAMEAACLFFEAGLRDLSGGRARDYLAKRGVAPATQAAFRLGYARDARHALKEHLAARGFAAEEMAQAGLVIAGDDIPVSYDRFRDRIIFPIRDSRDQVIAFGGRALSADAPAKYLNSPETPLFHKGHVLFNARGAREAAFRDGTLIVVEGYMDVIALAEAGYANAVAPLGTALTEDQMKLLWRMAAEPVLCFDGDEAGRKAAWRAVDTALPLLAAGHSLRFAFLPEGRDPDDLVREEGAGAFQRLVDKAQALAQVLWAREVQAGDWTTPERRAALEDRLAGLLRQIGDARVRRHYAQAIADRLKALWGAHTAQDGRGRADAPFPRDGLRGRQSGFRRPASGLRLAKSGPSESLKQSPLVCGAPRAQAREALILHTLLNHPWLIEARAEEIAGVAFEHAAFGRLRDAILACQIGDAPLDSHALHNQLRGNKFGAVVSQVERAITHKSNWFAEPGASRVDVETGWRQILALHRKSVELERELAAAERAFQAEGSETALARLYDIRAQLFDLDGTEAVVEGYGAESGRRSGRLS